MLGYRNPTDDRYLEGLLQRYLGDNVTVHTDDILIFTDTKRQCIALSQEVVDTLQP